jgi:hypothetical protein
MNKLNLGLNTRNLVNGRVHMIAMEADQNRESYLPRSHMVDELSKVYPAELVLKLITTLDLSKTGEVFGAEVDPRLMMLKFTAFSITEQEAASKGICHV